MISQKALSIYVDHVIRSKSATLRKENEALKPAKNMLESVKIVLPGSDSSARRVKQFNLKKELPIMEDETSLSFALDTIGDIPHEDVTKLCVSISGSTIYRPFGGLVQGEDFLTINYEENSVQVKISFGTDAYIFGQLHNFEGTLDEIQEMIYHNQHTVYFLTLGFELSGRRQFSSMGSCLRGAIFSPEMITIAKDAVPTVLRLDKDEYGMNIDDNESSLLAEEFEELHTLAEAVVDHQELSAVMEERLVLGRSNTMLRSCWDFAQTLEARYPGGTLHFKLADGCKKSIMRNDTAPKWSWPVQQLSKPPGVRHKLLLSSISNLNFQIADRPWGNFNLSEIPAFSDNGFMLLRYGHCITAVFIFNETLNEFGPADERLPGGLFNYIRSTLTRTIEHAPNVAQAPDNGEEPFLTMELAWLQIDFPAIRRYLDVLGIDYNKESTTKEEDE